MHQGRNIDIETTIERVTWDNVRSKVKKVNPILAKIIDDLSPPDDCVLYCAKYPYGSEIIQSGKLYIPHKGSLVPIDCPDVRNEEGKQLGYNQATNPVSMLLAKTTEIFINVEQHTIPLYGAISAGKVIGTWHVLNKEHFHSPPFIWSMTSGARSIFTLPKISTESGYRRLRREFNLDVSKPKKFLDHWQIFKGIANSKNFTQSWNTEILFFGYKWFEKFNDPAWMAFHRYLLEQGWHGSEIWRNQFMWNMAYSLIERKLDLKVDQYIKDTAKHIVSMTTGALPGFAASMNDDVAPIKGLQAALVEIYKLNDYYPLIMEPARLGADNRNIVYYSLDYPITTVFPPRARQSMSKIYDLYELKNLLGKYKSEILHGDLNLSGNEVVESIKNSTFSYYHDDHESYYDISEPANILTNDPDLLALLGNDVDKFAVNSAFLRGCIAISKLEKK